MSTPEFLRALQAAILADAECVPLVCMNEAKWLTPPEYGEEEELNEVGEPTGKMVTVLLKPGVPNPKWLPGHEVVARDRQIAAIQTEKGFGATSRQVPCDKAKKLLLVRGKWRAIKAAAENENHAATAAAYVAVELAEDARMTVDFLDDKAQPMLDALVAGELIDEEDKAALRALCLQPNTLTAEPVSLALRGPWYVKNEAGEMVDVFEKPNLE